MNSDRTPSHYTMVIQWDPIDRIHIVTVPELPGCRTHGATLEEAVRMADEAISVWLDGENPLDSPDPNYFDVDAENPPAWRAAWNAPVARRAS